MNSITAAITANSYLCFSFIYLYTCIEIYSCPFCDTAIGMLWLITRVLLRPPRLDAEEYEMFTVATIITLVTGTKTKAKNKSLYTTYKSVIFREDETCYGYMICIE